MNQAVAPKRLGTFLGVFTPTILTILGVILFLRVGWLAAVAGTWGTLVIVVLANAITALTALSVSALATNMRVGVGGAYFIISRTLGIEFGGAIGIPLFLSQVLSITLYCYGLAESLRVVWPGVPVAPVAALFVVLVTAVASRSTELTLKLQLPVMVLIGAALASLLLGASWGTSELAAWGPFTDAVGPLGFWGAFAVFFPAVTGILAGVSLSGDLEDPATAIPRGVLSAVFLGLIVYLIVPFALAGSASREVLLADSLVWTQVATVPALVMPGLWGAILSSAFGSALGAPRTLQALSEDRVLPGFLGRVDDETGEPIFGLYLSGAMALAAVFLGALNVVASWVTIFFLTTYGALNLVAAIEVLVGDPGYRPTIRIPWWAPLLGAAGCFVAMFAVDPVACAIAIAVEVAIFFVLRRRAMEVQFGDVRSGLLLSTAHALIVWFTDARKEARSWRPHVLLCAQDLERELPAIRMADHFGDQRGLLTVVQLLERPLGDFEPTDAQVDANQRWLHEHGIDAFSEVVLVPEASPSAVATIAQAHGFGGMCANTVLFPWDGRDVDELAERLAEVRTMSRLGKCTLIHRALPGDPLPSKGDARFVVWWKGMESNGDLMLLLAYLLTRQERFRTARIVLRTVVEDPSEAARWRETVQALAENVRIAVDAAAILPEPGESVTDVIRRESQGAQLVMLGMTEVRAGEEAPAAARLVDLLRDLPDVLLVRNAGPFRGRLL